MNKKIMVAIGLSAALLSGFWSTDMAQARGPENPAYVAKALHVMEGNWYDHDGNLVLTIHDGYINDCQVLGGYDFAGGTSHANGRFVILESTGKRSLYLQWEMWGGDKDTIKLNDSQLLHRVSQPSYYESVAGIHLGMTSAEVEATYGKPTYTGDLKGYIGWTMYGWYYANGMAVTFNADSVDRIMIIKGSNLILAKSGLNCANTPEEFARAYHMNRVPKVDFDNTYTSDGCHSIGQGEYLAFGNHMSYIMLTNYSN